MKLARVVSIIYLEFTPIARMQSSPPGLFYIGSIKIKRWFATIAGCGVDPKISCWQITMGKNTHKNSIRWSGDTTLGCFGLRWVDLFWDFRQNGKSVMKGKTFRASCGGGKTCWLTQCIYLLYTFYSKYLVNEVSWGRKRSKASHMQNSKKVGFKTYRKNM